MKTNEVQYKKTNRTNDKRSNDYDGISVVMYVDRWRDRILSAMLMMTTIDNNARGLYYVCVSICGLDDVLLSSRFFFVSQE